MIIVNGKTYKIKGNSDYFRVKYGTPNPEIIIERTDKEVFGDWCGIQQSNPACILYAMRTGIESIDSKVGISYYGHINSLGELVHETELKEREKNER
jgi:hypothetical protein